MKIIKILAALFLAIIAIWLIAAAFVSGDVKFEKSISINASPEQVWQQTNSLKAMDNWSPWNDKDPNLKKDWTGKTGEVGEQQCWEGNKDVGKGCQTVTKIDEAEKRIDTDMKFLGDYESEAKAYVVLSPEGNGTKAIWGFTSKIPYPWTVTKLMYNLEEMIGPDYQLGLERLKTLSEKVSSTNEEKNQ